MIELQLPWPPAGLSPNARLHWSAVAKLKKKCRADAYMIALASEAQALKGCDVSLSLTFHPPTNGAYDLDNALARMKASLDGVADAMGVDDSKWSLNIAKGAKSTKGGHVDVRIIAVIDKKQIGVNT